MISGNLLKLSASLSPDGLVHYSLPLGENLLPLNDLVGKKISLKFTGLINCIATGKKIKKTYGNGYSFEAFMTLARTDICMVRPELCHYHKGTCREPKWAEEHCLKPHIVYLSYSSNLKVGITRKTQIPTRWIDQGAIRAIKLVEVSERLYSGLIEVELAKFFQDKTNWRGMITTSEANIDLVSKKAEVIEQFKKVFEKYNSILQDDEVTELLYPVKELPRKLTSLSFDKTPIIEEELLGIKGQYLIFSSGVINMRKHQGYFLEVDY